MVNALTRAGVYTAWSCQGGHRHYAQRPWVRILGDEAALWRAVATCDYYRWPVTEVRPFGRHLGLVYDWFIYFDPSLRLMAADADLLPRAIPNTWADREDFAPFEDLADELGVRVTWL